MAEENSQLTTMLSELLAPLIEKDGGRLYLVSLDRKKLCLHLAGTYGGCPGTPLVVSEVLTPAVKAVAPRLTLEISSGWQVPEGADRIEAVS